MYTGNFYPMKTTGTGNCGVPAGKICTMVYNMWVRLQRAIGESDTVNRGQVFIHLQGLGSSQLVDHLANEINQGPCYVNDWQTLDPANV